MIFFKFAKYGNPSPDGMEAHGLPKWNKFGEEKVTNHHCVINKRL